MPSDRTAGPRWGDRVVTQVYIAGLHTFTRMPLHTFGEQPAEKSSQSLLGNPCTNGSVASLRVSITASLLLRLCCLSYVF